MAVGSLGGNRHDPARWSHVHSCGPCEPFANGSERPLRPANFELAEHITADAKRPILCYNSVKLFGERWTTSKRWSVNAAPLRCSDIDDPQLT